MGKNKLDTDDMEREDEKVKTEMKIKVEKGMRVYF